MLFCCNFSRQVIFHGTFMRFIPPQSWLHFPTCCPQKLCSYLHHRVVVSFRLSTWPVDELSLVLGGDVLVQERDTLSE